MMKEEREYLQDQESRQKPNLVAFIFNYMKRVV